jgi:hypothetical protein
MAQKIDKPQTPELRKTVVMRRTSLAVRDFEDLKIHEKVEILCDANSLSDAVKEGIIKLCKESYIKGSNDCYDIWVRCK